MYDMSKKTLESFEKENKANEYVSMTYKDLSKKEKVHYIWDYYKLHIIGSVIGIVFLVGLTTTIVTNINTVTLIDVSVISREYEEPAALVLHDDWLDLLYDSDSKKKQIIIFENINIDENLDPTSQMTYQSKLTAKMTAKMLDIMIMEKDFFVDNSDVGILADMSALLDLKALGVPEEDWYYVNNQVVSINVSDYPAIQALTYNDTQLFLGIFYDAGNTENALK
ncbi:MAG: hypothetical protein PF505_04345, partial [Vallitaleaceae bacterium]|nr:hypothetical protein [Vallitaleaceae bacterium]